MADEPTATALPTLARTGVLGVFGAAGDAFRTVPGLRWFALRGFLLNYLVFIVTTAVMVGLVYTYLVAPYARELQSAVSGDGFWMGLLSGLMSLVFWISGLFLLAATFLLAAIVSLTLMSLWFETLTGRIVAHWRSDVSAPRFSLVSWLRSMGRALADALWLLLLSASTLLLGFIPLAGPVLVVAINSYLLGREVRDPYLTVLHDLAVPGAVHPAKTKGLLGFTLRMGILPVVLAAVPVVGWLVMPVALVYLVAGVAWAGERAHAG